VLTRLAETQEQHVRELAQSYLDSLSSAVTAPILREDTWEVFEAITQAQMLNRALHATEAIVTNADGRVIAASDPRKHPIGSLVPPPDPNELFHFEAGAADANATRVLAYPGRVVGVINATFDTRHLARERRSVLMALVVTNGVLTLLFAIAGWLVMAKMMAPVRVLAEHLGAAREGQASPIADAEIARTGEEFARLFRSYNALVRSMHEREELARQLADEHRLGSLGRLASALAHEINNPLGGLFNALATLKTHGHLPAARDNALGLLERGLVGIRDVVRAALALYRTGTGARPLTGADIDDLKLLVAPEARRRGITLIGASRIEADIALPSTPVRQAILNLLLNAVAAAPLNSTVTMEANFDGAAICVAILDQGPGMPVSAANLLTGRDISGPLREGGGLGLWTTRRIVDELGGAIDVAWPSAGGTLIRVAIPFKQNKEVAHAA
jgi:signal transduction histidine kinase